MDDYLNINLNAWNAVVPVNRASDFYDVAGFLQGKTSLNEPELALLGDIKGKRILHLQCHFGMDSISLARMGAEVTAVDFSAAAIQEAGKLNEAAGTNVQFVCTDVYSLPEHLSGSFDMVFTSYGVIGWLPDLQKWAAVVARFLKPDGTFIMAEFHPFIWMFDDALSEIKYSYFNDGPIVTSSEGTYADKNADLQTTEVGWNHSLTEVFDSLESEGVLLRHFREYDFSPYACFNNMELFAPGKYRFIKHGNKLPLMYTVTAVKR